LTDQETLLQQLDLIRQYFEKLRVEVKQEFFESFDNIIAELETLLGTLELFRGEILQHKNKESKSHGNPPWQTPATENPD